MTFSGLMGFFLLTASLSQLLIGFKLLLIILLIVLYFEER